MKKSITLIGLLLVFSLTIFAQPDKLDSERRKLTPDEKKKKEYQEKLDKLEKEARLTPEEQNVMEKVKRGMTISKSEEKMYNKAWRKREKAKEKYEKLREKMVYELQTPEVRKRMKANKKKAENRNKPEPFYKRWWRSITD